MKFLNNLNEKHKQYLFAGVIAVLGLGLVITAISSFSNDGADNLPRGEQKTEVVKFEQNVDPKEIWADKVDNEVKMMRKETEAMKKVFIDNTKELTEKHNELELMKAEIQELKVSRANEATNVKDAGNLAGGFGQSQTNPASNNALPETGFGNSTDGQQLSPASSGQALGPNGEILHKISLNLSPGVGGKDKAKIKTVENYIPAGAFAKVVMLGGVDASTNVAAQSDPRPVLLRLIDSGNLPRKFKSDLKACHITGSAYGDIASERAYIRLEKLTCTEVLTGEIVETQVAGYVAGEDGRAGVRGVVVDRAGDTMRNAFIAGFAGGISNFVGAQSQKGIFPVSPFGQTKALSASDMAKASAAQGANNALDKLSEFYIKRAEQLQPVLQIAAGRELDIVFTEGTTFGGTSVRDTIHKTRQKSRQQIVNNLENTSDNQNWLPTPGENNAD